MAPRNFTDAIQSNSTKIGLKSEVERALDSLEGLEYEQVLAALKDRSLPGAQVARALKAWGFTKVSAASVNTWRGHHA